MSDDETYEIHLQDQRVFGAGIKRQRVKFVPSSSSTPTPASPPSQSASDLYLSIVLSKNEPRITKHAPVILPLAQESNSDICEICKLPLSSALDSEDPSNPAKPRPHEASLSHQVCLAHSHPPSHIDRSRKGLGILSSMGWDPDMRVGLGAAGQGIRFPVKAKPKDDTMGIGVVLPPESERRKRGMVEKLDAGKVRKLYEKDRRKGERLREMFYRNDDVERYLGGG